MTPNKTPQGSMSPSQMDMTTAPNVAKKIKPQINRYYARIARRYKAAAVCTTIVLALFCLTVLAVGSEYITYDNLTYLARDFDLTMRSEEKAASIISYEQHEGLQFAPYKTGMAVCGSDSLTIYDSSGIVLSEDVLGYDTPCLSASDKYVLAYDLGGKKYGIYNALTRVVKRDTEYKIIGADMSDSGAFVLWTRSNETKYVVELYNAALNRTMSIYKDQYVMDAAIRNDGERVVIVSAIPQRTDLACEVSLCGAGEAEPLMTVQLDSLMPLDAAFHPDGSFSVICDGAVLFFDKTGAQINRYNISGMTLVDADMARGYVALIGAENALGSENRLVILDRDGNVLLSQMYRERMQQVCVTVLDGTWGDMAASRCAVLTPSEVLLFGENGILSTCIVDDDNVLTIRTAAGGIMVCARDCMYPADFTSLDAQREEWEG